MNLLHGTKGHPRHPPLTNVGIGRYTFAAVLGVIGAAGGIEDAAGKGMCLALLGGLVFTLLAVATLLVGGWLGGTLVFVHGMRVVVDETASVERTADPLGEERTA